MPAKTAIARKSSAIITIRMTSIDRYAILKTAPKVDSETYRDHMTGFVNNFVRKDRRARWKYLLLERPARLAHDSSRLVCDLDLTVCTKAQSFAEIESIEGKGVYFQFSDDPVWLSVPEALELTFPFAIDSIVSLSSGKLAVYFFHEYERWICRKK